MSNAQIVLVGVWLVTAVTWAAPRVSGLGAVMVTCLAVLLSLAMVFA